MKFMKKYIKLTEISRFQKAAHFRDTQVLRLIAESGQDDLEHLNLPVDRQQGTVPTLCKKNRPEQKGEH